MKLSAKTRYASRILLDLALIGEGTTQRVVDISARTGISVSFIEQILKPLKQAGLVVSKRGPSGGHSLAKAPEDISLGEIVRIMEDTAELAVCLSDSSSCKRAEGCPTRAAWQRVSAAMMQELDAISLADLAATGRAGCCERTGGL